MHIWEDLLYVHPIGLCDNFFSLGGHSLLAARMADRIEQMCGRKIPLSTLYAGATIEYLTEVLLQEESAGKAQDESRAKVVLVQAGKRGTRPFFFLHGDWYGGGFYCLNLARGLDDDRPFYVLEPYDFDRQQEPPGERSPSCEASRRNCTARLTCLRCCCMLSLLKTSRPLL